MSTSSENSERTREKLKNRYGVRKYRIQEVIRPGQVILIQINKEERGQKGAALTTFISLAGKYIVLMPNTAKGGGISRKIINHDDFLPLMLSTNTVFQNTFNDLFTKAK